MKWIVLLYQKNIVRWTIIVSPENRFHTPIYSIHNIASNTIDMWDWAFWNIIPIFQSVVWLAELGIKGPLEYLQVYATTLVSLLFIYVIPIDCKITNFSLYLYIQ